MVYTGAWRRKNAVWYSQHSWVGRFFSSRTDFGDFGSYYHMGSALLTTLDWPTTWFMDGSSKVSGKHCVQKAAILQLTDGKILIEEGKNKPSQWTKLHPVFLAVMEDLNNNKSPNVLACSDLWVVAKDQAIRSGILAMENWIIKGTPVGEQSWFKSLQEFKRRIKVEHMMASRWIPFADRKGLGSSKWISSCTHFRWPPGSMKWVCMKELQQCQDGLIQYMPPAPSKAKTPARETETADAYGADSPGGRPYA